MNNQMVNQSESENMFNQFYKTKIDRPYANIDLTRIPSWDMVIRIMEQQAMAARLQHPVPKYSHNTQHCQTSDQMEAQSSQNQQADLIPIHISCDYQEYHTFNGNHGNSNGEDSDVSSYCSSRINTSSAATSSNSSEESDGSDIEIDVEDCSDDNSDEDYYMMGSSMDNIPITVLQLESKLRERDC